jgi:hypothetical protein
MSGMREFVRVKYNSLALAQTAISLANTVLFMRVFGAGDNTDAYFVSQTVIAALNLLQLLFVEQFMFFYNDYKVGGERDRQSFVNSAVTLAVLVGLVAFCTFAVLRLPISRVFALGFRGADLERLVRYYSIAVFAVVGFPANYISDNLMIAERKYSPVYFFNIGNLFLLLLYYIYAIVTNARRIETLLWFQVGLTLIVPIVKTVYLRNALGIRVKPQLNIRLLKPFIINSLKIRAASNIHNFLFTPITNGVLTILPGNFPTYYGYAMKFIGIIQTVMVAPSQRIYVSQLSSALSEGKGSDLSKVIVRYVAVAGLLVVFASAVAYFAIPALLSAITTGDLGSERYGAIQQAFLFLSLWQLVVTVESGPVGYLVARKQSGIFIVVNSVFISLYFLTTSLLRESLGAYSLYVCVVACQLVSMATISTYCARQVAKTRTHLRVGSV